MEARPIRRRWPIRLAGTHHMEKTARRGLCAVALLVSAGWITVLAQAQGVVPRPGSSSTQSPGTTVGDAEQGQRAVEASCATCHGADGNSPDPQYPKLAGQSRAYLYSQLLAFKRGARSSQVMSGIVASLSDAQMGDAADFFSRQPRTADTVKDRRLAAIGERIFFGSMPACAMCHGSAGQRGMPMMGPGMMGMMGHGMMGMRGFGDVPRLNGQHAAYVVDQLYRFAAGARWGTVMNRIAASLSEQEMKAVAEYLSGLR